MFQSKAKTVFSSIVKAYNKNLLLSNTLSTMALLGTGDLIAQVVEAKLRLAAANEQSPRLFPQMPESKLAGLLSPESLSGMPSCLVSLLPNKPTTVGCSLYADRGFYAVKEAPKAKPGHKEPSVFDEIDFKRSARVALIGLIMGPFGHYWFQVLEKILPAKTLACVLAKVCMDQIISAPLLNVFYIFGSHLLDGMKLNEIVEVFKQKFPTIYAYDCTMWPVAQLINFSMVPAMYRLLYVNALSLVWNSIMSYLLFEKSANSSMEQEMENPQ